MTAPSNISFGPELGDLKAQDLELYALVQGCGLGK